MSKYHVALSISNRAEYVSFNLKDIFLSFPTVFPFKLSYKYWEDVKVPNLLLQTLSNESNSTLIPFLKAVNQVENHDRKLYLVA